MSNCQKEILFCQNDIGAEMIQHFKFIDALLNRQLLQLLKDVINSSFENARLKFLYLFDFEKHQISHLAGISHSLRLSQLLFPIYSSINPSLLYQ